MCSGAMCAGSGEFESTYTISDKTVLDSCFSNLQVTQFLDSCLDKADPSDPPSSHPKHILC